MNCPYCNKKVSDDAVFCTECGARVIAYPQNTTATQPSESRVVLQIKWNFILHIIRDCFGDVGMSNSRLFDADSALCFI